MSSELARLVGLSEPHLDQVWRLGSGSLAVGRRGRRANQVELDDPTVSRAHATLRLEGPAFHLLAQSSAPTAVNLRALATGEAIALEHLDQVRLGYQVLRFEDARRPRRAASLLYLDLQARGLARCRLSQLLGAAVETWEQRGATVLPCLARGLTAVFSHLAGALEAALETHSQLAREPGPLDFGLALVRAEVSEFSSRALAPTCEVAEGLTARARRGLAVDESARACLPARFRWAALEGGYLLGEPPVCL